MRFIAPPRETLPVTVAAHPAMAGFALARQFLGADWPGLSCLNALLGDARHAVSGERLSFVAQDAVLEAEGMHYESRIFDEGRIATRERNWHDLFNALMWLERRSLKCAVNAAYAQDLDSSACRTRTRRQAALTHFDEAGAIVVINEPRLLAAWDRHDWSAVFREPAFPWARHAGIILFGHALLEHLLVPTLLPVAKCVVVLGDPASLETVTSDVARNILGGDCLDDPQRLRPLPLAGIPGWHADNVDPGFYDKAPCFRPLRPGRMYPTPLETPT
ncbi:MAG: hypothetical protein RL434_1663 [Pseudomonadota bacterium]|jgi:hypothetical protein